MTARIFSAVLLILIGALMMYPPLFENILARELIDETVIHPIVKIVGFVVLIVGLLRLADIGVPTITRTTEVKVKVPAQPKS